MKNQNLKIFLSPLFLLGLFLLLLNDFFLKSYFHNFLTGKLSDFAGLFIFPIFFCAFFPSRKVSIFVSTGLFFIFWKSSLSQIFIDIWNSFPFFKVGRIIDFTDLTALLILPLSYLYFSNLSYPKSRLNSLRQVATSLIAITSAFAFVASTDADEQNIQLEGKYKFKLKASEIEKTLQQNERILNLKVERETDEFPSNQYPQIKTDPNGFYVNFSLNQRICDTDHPTIFFHIQENNLPVVSNSTTDTTPRPRKPAIFDFAEISSATLHFRCQAILEQNSNVAYKQYLPELNSLFENEIINKLKDAEAQSSK